MQRLGVTPQAVAGLDGDDASAPAGEPRRIAAAAGADVEDEPWSGRQVGQDGCVCCLERDLLPACGKGFEAVVVRLHGIGAQVTPRWLLMAPFYSTTAD